jgi:hypothetical protein
MKKDSTTLADSPRSTSADTDPISTDSALAIIRRAQAEIEVQKERLKAERTDLAVRIREIDQILGTSEPTLTAKRGRKAGSVAKVGRKITGGKRGTSTKDIILGFLKDGNAKGTKDIAAAVKAAGKSPLIGGVLATLVKEKKIANPARGQYKLK